MNQMPASTDPSSRLEAANRLPLTRIGSHAARLDAQDDYFRPESGYTGRAMLAILNRHKKIIASCVILLTLASAVVALTLPRSYVAEAILILDTRRQDIVQQPAALSNLVSGSTADPAIVRSEVAVLNSPAFARKVIGALDLLHDPVFKRENDDSGLMHRIGGAVTQARIWLLSLFNEQPKAAEPTSEIGRAVVALQDHLVIYNDDRSYAIALRYRSQDPNFAAKIVNALAQIYVSEQRNNGVEAAEKAGAWLRGQLGGLEAKARASERKVAEFEQENHIETVLSGNVTEQRVHQLNMELLAAGDDLVRKQAQLDQATALMKSPEGAYAAAQVLSSPLIQKLRQDQAAAEAKLAPLKGVYSSAYPNGEPRTRIFTDMITGEVNRIVSSLRTDVLAAQVRQQALQTAIQDEQAKLDKINSARVQLVQLQHEATANRNIYDSFLVRSQQIEADAQSLQVGVRIVPAEPPVIPAFPNKVLFIGFGFFGSLFLGVVLAFIAEQFDETVRTPEAASRLTGVPTIGILPRLRNGARVWAAVLDAPLSAYTDAINRVLLALGVGERGQPCRVVALTSSVQNEGKTMTAATLARAAALTGIRTLLIDCDLRKPGVASLLDNRTSRSPGKLSDGEAMDLARTVQKDRASGLDCLLTAQAQGRPSEVLRSDWMRDVIAQARRSYDLVVLDTPPLLSVSDALLASRLSDATLLVVRWGRTPGALVEEAARLLQVHGTNPTGTILSLVDMRKYGRYRHGGYYRELPYHRRLTAADAY